MSSKSRMTRTWWSDAGMAISAKVISGLFCNKIHGLHPEMFKDARIYHHAVCTYYMYTIKYMVHIQVYFVQMARVGKVYSKHVILIG